MFLHATLLVLFALAQDDFPTPPNTQELTTPLLTAEAALAALDVPDGFEANLFASEPEIQQPIAMTFDSRGRTWVAENYTYSDRKENYNLELYDRILMFEDLDDDGVADRRTVFHDRLQRLTSVEVGFGGVWALCPPNLLFIPDADGDAKPDGDPVVMLEGWDDNTIRHNFANGLRWGPDGWLYGRHGIMATSTVGAPNTPKHERTEMSCGIWRFHPVDHRFEVVCSGTTNPFGMDWDANGQLFFINTVIGHLWHAIPGAHFKRMYGEDLNPYLYELIDQTADHVHWDEATENWTDQKKGLSEGTDEAGGGHAHSGMMIYQGTDWPAEYRGELFTLNFHGRRVNQEHLRRAGATYVGEHRPDFMESSDLWFRGIEIAQAPDGSVFILDWSDIGECHENDGVHRTSGRIYRVASKGSTGLTAESVSTPDLETLNDEQLTSLVASPNEWVARQARQLLHQHAAAGNDMTEAHRRLATIEANASDTHSRLRALWALHITDGLNEEELIRRLEHQDEHVRTWAIQLLVDDDNLSKKGVAALTELAQVESSGLVQTYLASAMQRMAHSDRWAIATALASNAVYAYDRVLPLMVWYGVEPAVPADVPRALQLMRSSKLPTVTRLIARRVASLHGAGEGSLALLIDAVLATEDEGNAEAAILGLSDAMRGWHKVDAPANWQRLLERFESTGRARVEETLLEVSVVFGEGRAIDEVLAIASDSSQSIDGRRSAIRTLVAGRVPEVQSLLEKLITDRDLGGEAVRGLGQSSSNELHELLVKKYNAMGRLGKRAAVEVLASRRESAVVLIGAVQSGKLPKKDVPAFVLRQIQMLGDEELADEVAQLWPETQLIDSDKLQMIGRYKELVERTSLSSHNVEQGKALFTKHCANCHKLFGEGSEIAPDLTGAQRGNLTYWLENILDPSAEVAASFRMSVVELEDGRVLNGVVLGQTDRQLTLQTDSEKLQIPSAEVYEITPSHFSLMPDGLLTALSDNEALDLFAYLTVGTDLNQPEPDAEQPVSTSVRVRRYLYVAEPGIRNYVRFGGHGILVFDIEQGYRFVKRIPMPGLDDEGQPLNVKGICGSAITDRLYVSTIKHLICVDLKTDEVLWERGYELGCDRMSMSPDGKIIYQPSFEKDAWYVLDAATGDEIARVEPKSRAHNTVYGNDGRFVYMAGLGSNMLSVADTESHKIVKQIGPFSERIRPFTVNHDQTLCFVNVNDLLGFEIGDLRTGEMLHRVEVTGYKKGPVARHGCPSHGIALTPDESQIWVTDGHNECLHVFDATVMPPIQFDTIELREQPGWITFSINGKTCWPSTGEVIDVASRTITDRLTDEQGRMVMSEKLLEVQFSGTDATAVGDQFGKGQRASR